MSFLLDVFTEENLVWDDVYTQLHPLYWCDCYTVLQCARVALIACTQTGLISLFLQKVGFLPESCMIC